MNGKADGKRKTGYNTVNCLKGVSGKVIVDEKEIKDLFKKYMEKLVNEENEWDDRIMAGPANYVRSGEVAAALKKIKRHKAQLYQG